MSNFKLGKLSLNQDQIEILEDILRSVKKVFLYENSVSATQELIYSELSELDREILAEHERESINLNKQITNDTIQLTRSDFNKLKNEIVELKKLVNTNQNQSFNSIRSISEINDNETLIKKIHNFFDKKIRYENHINIAKTHLSNKTVPKSLNHNNFPEPFLIDDKNYVEFYK